MGEREQTRSSRVSPAEIEHRRRRLWFHGHCDFRARDTESEVCAPCRCSLVSMVLAPCYALCDLLLLFT